MDMSDFFKEFQSAYSHATRLPPYHFENMLERLLSVHRDSFLFENDSGMLASEHCVNLFIIKQLQALMFDFIWIYRSRQNLRSVRDAINSWKL